jgi:hypothetical protein
MKKIAGSGSISQRHGSADPDPDPHQHVMDPEHCYQGLKSTVYQLDKQNFLRLQKTLKASFAVNFNKNYSRRLFKDHFFSSYVFFSFAAMLRTVRAYNFYAHAQ